MINLWNDVGKYIKTILKNFISMRGNIFSTLIFVDTINLNTEYLTWTSLHKIHSGHVRNIFNYHFTFNNSVWIITRVWAKVSVYFKLEITMENIVHNTNAFCCGIRISMWITNLTVPPSGRYEVVRYEGSVPLTTGIVRRQVPYLC